MSQQIDPQWRPVPGTDGYYEVSSRGQVRSWKRGRWGRRETPKILVQSLGATYGYRQVSLWADGKNVKRYVHHLVAELFIGPRPEGHDVCHNDSDVDNNDVSNLRYDTRKGNLEDAARRGTRYYNPKGKVCNTKLTVEQVRHIRSLPRSEKHTDVAARYGVGPHAIYEIRTGRTWRNV